MQRLRLSYQTRLTRLSACVLLEISLQREQYPAAVTALGTIPPMLWVHYLNRTINMPPLINRLPYSCCWYWDRVHPKLSPYLFWIKEKNVIHNGSNQYSSMCCICRGPSSSAGLGGSASIAWALSHVSHWWMDSLDLDHSVFQSTVQGFCSSWGGHRCPRLSGYIQNNPNYLLFTVIFFNYSG
jgi:hypothetical protein